MKQVLSFFILITFQLSAIYAQPKSGDSLLFRKIFDEALLRGHSYARLGELCKKIGSRLSGSDQAEKGIDWAIDMLNSYNFDSVYKQPVMVPRWQRNGNSVMYLKSTVLQELISGTEVEKAKVNREINKKAYPHSPNPEYECNSYINWLEKQPFDKAQAPIELTAMGGSVGGSFMGDLVVVKNKKELDSLGENGLLKGKMVLLNRAFEEENIKTFLSYGSCVTQRVYGAIWAAPYGVKAVIIRSLSNSCDMHPHTGVTYYEDSITKIPIAAVSTAAADALSYFYSLEGPLAVNFELKCETLPDRLSANVVAETKGNEFTDRIIAMGGHFDSWDEGEGAHDDGAGIMHCFEALRILKVIGYQPRHTIRCVFWINEENGMRGALKYAELASLNNETHVAALESDRGGFTPRGFAMDSSILSKAKNYQDLLRPYGIAELELGGGGVDIGPLKKQDKNTQLVAFVPDSQRYFDVHHAETDVFENVNKRELELGAAAVAVAIYIIDQELD